MRILKVFSLAVATQKWNWPRELPAYVMAEAKIDEAHTALLDNVYRGQFDGCDRRAIKENTHLQAFAKPPFDVAITMCFRRKTSASGPARVFQTDSGTRLMGG